MILARPAASALFLDLDGTLLDVAATPQSVTVPLDLPVVLRDLHQALGGALAIVTGRPIADLDRLLAPTVLPAAGVHGAEVRLVADGGVTTLARAVPAELVGKVRALAERYAGCLVETKGAAVAVHYRLAPAAAPMVEHQLRRLATSEACDYRVASGRMVLELQPRHLSKGSAIVALSDAAPFAGRIPIMIGDDLGDEPAFAECQARGGHALRVAGEYVAESRAHFADPAETLGWVRKLRTAMTGMKRVG